MSAPISTCRASSTATTRSTNAADAEAYLARLASYPQQLDGELGRVIMAALQGADPAGLPDRQGARPDDASSVKGAREGGGLVESIERRTAKGHPRQLGRARPGHRPAEGRAGARAADRRAARSARHGDRWTPACGRGPHGDEFYRWALKASTTTQHDARRDPPDGPRPSCASCTAGWTRSCKSLGYTKGSVGARMTGAGATTRATSSPRATRAAPRSWPSSRSGCGSSAPSCRALSARWSAATSR